MLEQLIKDFEIARNNCETVLYNGKPCPYSDVCIVEKTDATTFNDVCNGKAKYICAETTDCKRDYQFNSWNEKFGEKVKLMIDGRMTQRELAEKIGVTEVTLSRYITGKRTPKGPLIVKIAKALDVPVEDLIDFED